MTLIDEQCEACSPSGKAERIESRQGPIAQNFFSLK